MVSKCSDSEHNVAKINLEKWKNFVLITSNYNWTNYIRTTRADNKSHEFVFGKKGPHRPVQKKWQIFSTIGATRVFSYRVFEK